MIILIDNGHGQDTKGKHSPLLKDSGLNVWDIFTENGRFKEWKYTRVVAKDIVAKLKGLGYDARLVVTENSDISLGERVKRVNAICDKYGAKNVLLVSVHANAVGDGSQWMSGKGWEAYTTKGTTKSDKLAEYLYKRAEKNMETRKIRKDPSDGDSDKEANFYIIKHAKCPAVLTENFFYDNKDDLKYLTSDEGLNAVERAHVEGILDYVHYMEGKK